MRTPASSALSSCLLALACACGEQQAAGSWEARTQSALDSAERELEQASLRARAAFERARAELDGRTAQSGASWSAALDQFEAALVGLRADLERKGGEGRERLVRELGEHLARAREHVAALQASGEADWAELSEQVEREALELERRLREALEAR